MPIIKNAAEGVNISVKYPINGAKTAYIKLLDILWIDITVALWWESVCSFIPLFTKTSLTPHVKEIMEINNNANNLLTKKIPIKDKLAIKRIIINNFSSFILLMNFSAVKLPNPAVMKYRNVAIPTIYFGSVLCS